MDIIGGGGVMILPKLDIVEIALMAFDHVGPTYIQRA